VPLVLQSDRLRAPGAAGGLEGAAELAVPEILGVRAGDRDPAATALVGVEVFTTVAYLVLAAVAVAVTVIGLPLTLRRSCRRLPWRRR
jgi:hypothetical protein